MNKYRIYPKSIITKYPIGYEEVIYLFEKNELAIGKDNKVIINLPIEEIERRVENYVAALERNV